MQLEHIPAALVASRFDAYTNKVVAVICSLLEKDLAAEKAAQIKPGLKRAIWAERDFCMNLLGLNRNSLPKSRPAAGPGPESRQKAPAWMLPAAEGTDGRSDV